MVVKTRVVSRYTGGSYTDWDGSVGYGPSGAGGEYMETHFSPGPPYTEPNNWTHIIHGANPVRISGTGYPYNVLSQPRVYSGYAVDNINLGVSNPNPNHDALVTSALANINPDKPQVDAPLFLWELQELPGAIRDIGIGLGGKTQSGNLNPGSIYLSWQFGWGPLFSDLANFLSLADATQKRLAQLRKASRREHIEGSLFDSSNSWTSSNYKMYGISEWRINYTARERAWYTTSYQFDQSQLEGLDSSGIPRLRWALGLHARPSTIWNAIPWTWMVDYFGNIGTFLEANQGRFKFSASNMCTMYEHTLIANVEDIPHWHYKGKDTKASGSASKLYQSRRVHPSPAASVRFSNALGKQQINNLTALATSAVSIFAKGKSRSSFAANG